MARPEFPTAALDVTTLTELEYSCEWVPRGGFDTVMHLLAPPFVLPANLKEKLPKLARLVLRCVGGCCVWCTCATSQCFQAQLPQGLRAWAVGFSTGPGRGNGGAPRGCGAS